IGVASIYLGLGGGAFAPRTDYPAGPGVTSVAIGDLDGDGALDLATGGLGGLFVLLGLPGGSFGPPSAHSGFSPRRVQIGDMDGDGRPDLAFGIIQLVGVTPNTGPALAVNHAPAITASGSLTVPPGTPVHLMATAMDADPLQKVTITSTVSPPAPWLVPAGGVSALLPVVTASRSGTPGASDGGTYTITWTSIDNSTGAATGTATTVVTVPSTNQPPIVSIASPPSGAVFAVGIPVSFTGSFTDDAGDTHTATWSFDALSTPGIVNEATGAVAASYTFTAAGVYSVSLTVTDNHGAFGTANTVAEFSAMVVIYDPDAGFVTGGGWIPSPAGAYPVDPSLAGKANFGFVSKYKRGATVPIGETEFAFNVANLSFHSATYEWLVIAGQKAQYKGSGTINGTGNYRFILTATDGQTNGGGGFDKLRMKIWNDATSEIVYDNQAGDPDGASPVTALGGGSIVIHTSSGNAGDSPTTLETMKKFALLPNTPNPFNPETSIPYEVAATTRVRIRIFDSSGRLVANVVDGVQNPGRYAATWSGRTRFGSPAASGIYYVLMEAADHREKRAIVMLK
ncbi:MAG TPA: PKD domain-containing protein, partial [Candidatus Eisenbacteria bacterium]|nr:PKD domain-containing protein [Candidatus Eisenbacteria bacterium]